MQGPLLASLGRDITCAMRLQDYWRRGRGLMRRRRQRVESPTRQRGGPVPASRPCGRGRRPRLSPGLSRARDKGAVNARAHRPRLSPRLQRVRDKGAVNARAHRRRLSQGGGKSDGDFGGAKQFFNLQKFFFTKNRKRVIMRIGRMRAWRTGAGENLPCRRSILKRLKRLDKILKAQLIACQNQRFTCHKLAKSLPVAWQKLANSTKNLP